MRFLGVLSLLACLSTALRSQNSYTLDLEQGFLFLHSQDVAPIGQSYPRALNISYNNWLLDTAIWQNCKCFPRIGFGLGFHTYDNPRVLGWGLPIYAFLEPWYKLSPKLFLQLRSSLGLIYLSQPYDAQDNPLNLSYSLPISAYLSMGLGLAYQIDPNWRLGFQVSYDHTSNGGIREPNKGLNYPMFGLMADYSLKPLDFQSGKKLGFLKSGTKFRRAWSLHSSLAAKAGATVGEGEQEQDVTYLVYGASLRYSHQLSWSSALFGSLDWLSNGAYEKQIRSQGIDKSHHQLALELGHEFLLGKFIFSQAAGFYLFKEFGAQADWYQRYVLLYYPIDKFGFGPGLKAHAQVAEFLEFRIVCDL